MREGKLLEADLEFIAGEFGIGLDGLTCEALEDCIMVKYPVRCHFCPSSSVQEAHDFHQLVETGYELFSLVLFHP